MIEQQAPSPYINFRVYSEYSLGFGAVKFKDLIKQCLKYNIPAVAVTDKNNLFGSLEFSLEAAKNGIQPIIGLDLTVQFHPKVNSQILLIAKNQIGYNNILKLSTQYFLDKKNGLSFVSFDKLKKLNEGLIVFSTGIDSYPYKMFKDNQLEEAAANIKNLNEIFNKHHYIEIDRSTFQPHSEYEDFILNLAYQENIPLIATNPVTFLDKNMFEAHDALICIAAGRYITEENRPKANGNQYFKNINEFYQLYLDIPEAINNTITLAKRCSVMSEGRDPLLPKFSKRLEEEDLSIQAKNGLFERISDITDEEQRLVYFNRLEFELSVITKMQYAGYFLIVSDFVKWSKSNNIPVGPGRGSGVGSIVAWSLEITDLDPLRFGLLFERFLNPERVSMPDFDIDFCQDRRHEVIEYVRNKYGEDKVAQIITFGKLQARAVLRDVGRVLQMPYGVIDKICKMVPNNPANPITLKEAINLDKELLKSSETDADINKLLKISLQLEGINRHSSTHAAGVVIADRPIVELVPLYKDDESDMPAVQYSMKYAETAGLVKFDFLGLKTLTVISWTCELLKRKIPDFDINKIDLKDRKTYDLLSKGETVGVFQFESAGMKEAIKKLKPDAIEDLIALGSLYRPGPMDNIPSYINRKHGLEQPDYLHPKMEEILKETYGIIVYQEQVMQIARVLANYTLGGADLLRRAMGKKNKVEMEAQRNIFVSGCIVNGIDKNCANTIFDFVEKFASYGFNKSHAAAYALISYQTAFLKANYPFEFLIASMNLEIDDTNKIHSFCQESKRLGIEILPPDINRSYANFTDLDGKINYALGALKSVGVKAIELLVKERTENGLYKNIFDFFERASNIGINKRMIENLARSGAFSSVYQNRNEILNNCELLLRYGVNHLNQKDTAQIGLFGNLNENISKPILIAVDELSFQKKLEAEFSSFGFYLTSHPLESYSLKLSKIRITESTQVDALASLKGVKLSVAGVIISKKIRSSKRGKYAFIQISDRSGLLEVSIFNELLLTQKEALLEAGSIVFIKIEARKDENGLKAIIEAIDHIDDITKNINTRIDLLISDINKIDLIKSMISTYGKPLRLILKIDTGENIVFDSKSSLFINEEGEEYLKKIPGIEMFEV